MAALGLVRTFFENQGVPVQEYEYQGTTITALTIPDASIEICSAMAHGGVAIAVGRGAMEDFLARAAGGLTADAFSLLPSVKALDERIGVEVDLVAYCDIESLVAKFRGQMRGEDRRRLEASGIARASVAAASSQTNASGARPSLSCAVRNSCWKKG